MTTRVTIKNEGPDIIEVSVRLPDGTVVPYEGSVLYAGESTTQTVWSNQELHIKEFAKPA